MSSMHGSNQTIYLMFMRYKGPEKNTKPRMERVEQAERFMCMRIGQKRIQNPHAFTNDLATL